jgi:hypothetical protein
MIIWTGWGILVPVVFFAVTILFQMLVDGILGPDTYSQAKHFQFFGTSAAALAVWLAGKRMNTKTERRVIDKETGEEMVLKSNHSFFFIPMQYWGFIIFALAVVLLFTS